MIRDDAKLLLFFLLLLVAVGSFSWQLAAAAAAAARARDRDTDDSVCLLKILNTRSAPAASRPCCHYQQRSDSGQRAARGARAEPRAAARGAGGGEAVGCAVPLCGVAYRRRRRAAGVGSRVADCSGSGQ